MNQQEHAGAYCAALNAAMNGLDLVCLESKRPTNRDELIPQTIKIEPPKLVHQKTSKSQDPIRRWIDLMLGQAAA